MRGPGDDIAEHAPPAPHRRALAIRLIAIVVILCAASLLLAPSRSPLLAAITLAPVLLLAAGGFVLVSLASLKTRPAPPCCARCGYPAEPAPAGRPCPECGAALTPDAICDRRPALPRRWAFLGLALFVLGVAAPLGPRIAKHRVLALLPTPVLVRLVDVEPDAWPQIARRNLRPRQTRALAEGLLRDFESRGPTARSLNLSAAQQWLAATTAAGKLEPDLLDRLMARADAQLEIVRRPPGRIARLRATPLHNAFANDLQLVIYVSPYTTDPPLPPSPPTPPDPTLPPTPDAALPTASFFPPASTAAFPIVAYPRPGNRPRAPRLLLAPDTRRVSATAVLALYPAGVSPGDIVWNPDGSCTLPADALWSRTLHLTAESPPEEDTP